MRMALPVVLAVLLLNSACDQSDGSGPATEIGIDFATDRGWRGGQSDYSTDTAPEDVVFEEGATLPAPFTGTGLLSSGINRSDDLFLYATRKFDGLLPNQRYRISFDLRILTDVASGCVGVGGAPGESVTVKAGASPIEPVTVETDGEFLMNIDKGNQVQSGADALALGNIANSSTDCEQRSYEEKLLSSTTPLVTQTDAGGALWIIFGIDSGFESGSGIYYLGAQVSATPL
jgi:hypothetical protein